MLATGHYGHDPAEDPTDRQADTANALTETRRAPAVRHGSSTAHIRPIRSQKRHSGETTNLHPVNAVQV